MKMKKLSLLLTLLLFVLALNVCYADAVPDIRGEFLGSYTTVVSNCTDSDSNGSYNAVLAMSISSQIGNTFGGSATGTFEVDGFTAIEYIQISGTITDTGQISGNTSHTFLGTGGEGTFTGQLSGDTLTIENPGHDTYGDTCTYIRTMSATREGGTTPSANFSANPTSGMAPLNVNFTDQSSGAITSWNWDFGDGTKSTLQNPSHIYTQAGTYSVSFTVSNQYRSDTEVKTNYIFVNDKLKLLPSDGMRGDEFGTSVSISGDYAVVGVESDRSSGAAYIFERNGSDWIEIAKLTPSDDTQYFGTSVSISGGFIIVGAQFDGDNGVMSGAAYIFERSGSDWCQSGTKIVPIIGK